MTPKETALMQAREVTARTGIKHVVREDYGKYLVVPLYAPRFPGDPHPPHDPGFAALGILVKESL